jgi:uncharacterized RDD family membrane protein YckC
MRNFSARETEWLLELDGIELATFWRRAFAFVFDWFLISVLMMPLVIGGTMGYLKLREMRGGPPMPKDMNFDLRPNHVKLGSSDEQLEKSLDREWIHIVTDITIPVLYFGLLTWRGKGRTPGKRLARIRVVSLVHRHLTLWHAVERALGYGAAALEGGFGFVQFFIHPYRRCVQDRIAETIVVSERGYQLMQSKQSHPLLPDEGKLAETHVADEALPLSGS